MYVVIVGAGEVGRHVAETLVDEGHEVVLVEMDEELARSLDASLNALVVHGSGVSAAALRRAGVDRADLFLAVTSTDEVNLIACMTARKYGPERLRVVARVRQSRGVVGEFSLSAEDLGLDALISPEQAISTAALDDLRFAGSGEMRELAGGKVVLVGLDLATDSPLVHDTLADLRREFGGEFVVVGVQGPEGRIPSGRERLAPNDRAFVVTHPRFLTELAILSGKPWYQARRVLIVGCGNTGLTLARALESRSPAPTIMEVDRERAELVAALLPRSLVLNADASDPEVLRRTIDEQEVDAIVVLLKDPEKAVLIGIFAASLGVSKVIVRCDKPDYTPFANRLGVDAVISPKQAMVDAIHRYIWRGRAEVTLLLGDRQAEVIHFTVPERPARGELCRRPLKDLNFPAGVVIGALIRGGEVIIAPEDVVLRPGDELVIVSAPEVLGRVEKMLS
jgi:trk system potassium uptake protein